MSGCLVIFLVALGSSLVVGRPYELAPGTIPLLESAFKPSNFLAQLFSAGRDFNRYLVQSATKAKETANDINSAIIEPLNSGGVAGANSAWKGVGDTVRNANSQAFQPAVNSLFDGTIGAFNQIEKFGDDIASTFLDTTGYQRI